MRGLLIRVGIDQAYGGWNAPIDPMTGEFVYVPIPDGAQRHRHPRLLARAGLDHPLLNAYIERLLRGAIAKNVSIDFMNHPTGHHAFDILDDNARSREIIRATVEFLKTHLLE